MANIQEFKSLMQGGGARPNQFRIMLTFPSFVSNGTLAAYKGQFLCKAASLPASTIEDIDVKYRGRQVHFAGERTYEPWTATIYNDTDFDIRNAFEQWQSFVQNNASTNGLVNPFDYQVQLTVEQLARNGDVAKTYVLYDAYPTLLSAIPLDFEQNSTIETFDVTFVYNYYTSDTTDSANGTSPIITL